MEQITKPISKILRKEMCDLAMTISYKTNMWNVSPTKKDISDCFLYLIVSYAESMNVSYETGLIKLWGFSYDQSDIKENIIGNNILAIYNGEIIDTLKTIHGIEMFEKNIKNNFDLFSFIKRNIAISPIIVSFDTYYCPWSNLFQKYHAFHYILINDMIKDCFICIESNSKNNEKLPFDGFENWRGHIFTFKLKKVTPNFFDYIHTIEEAVCFNKGNLIWNLNKCKEAFFKYNTFENDIKGFGNDFYAMPLIRSLKQLSDQRYCFSSGLGYIGKILNINNIFHNAQRSFSNCGELYNYLKMIIIKQILSNKTDFEKITNIIDDIINCETKNIKLIDEALSELRDGSSRISNIVEY